MKKIIVTAALASLGMLTPLAHAQQDLEAQQRLDLIEQRLIKQYNRIDAGVRNGDLTYISARQLRDQQQRIVQLKQRFLFDDYLNHYEFRKLNNALDEANRRIHRLIREDRTANRRSRHRHK